MDEHTIKLYLPLLVAFTPHAKKVVVSAMDVDEVYGSRSRPGNVDRSVPLPRTWVPLCKKSQPISLNVKKRIDTVFETARNILDCADGHIRNVHAIGIEAQHSIVRCMVHAFLHNSGKNTLCAFKGVQADEDTPYNWKNLNV